MNKTERSELKSLIRAQMRVLRTDVAARRAELIAAVDRKLETDYQAEMRRWDVTRFTVQEALREANRKVNDAYREHFGKDEWGTESERMLVSASAPAGPQRERNSERQRAVREIDALVQAAYTQLDRKETELVTELTVGALESEDAKAFLSRIPKVGDLVPASRLEELTGHTTGEEPAR